MTGAPPATYDLTMGRPISRRLFLVGGLAAAGGSWACRPGRGAAGAEALLRDLGSTLAVPEPRAVGEAYLAQRPAEADVEFLLREVLDGLPLDQPASREALAARFRKDFDEDRTVVADGWHLSVTEGRFCALLTLDH